MKVAHWGVSLASKKDLMKVCHWVAKTEIPMAVMTAGLMVG